MPEDRAAKRMRVDMDLDPALAPELAGDNKYHAAPAASLIQDPFHLPPDNSAAFNQYHWPAEPASASTSAGLSGLVIPQIANQNIDPPLPMGMRFSDETLHSAVAASAQRAGGMALPPPGSAGSAGGKAPQQVSMTTRSNGGSAAGTYNDGQVGGSGDGEGSRRPSETELHQHIHVHPPDDDGEDGEHHGGSQDSGPNRQTPFSRTPELKVHHKLAERQRRKEMKDLFDELREQLPTERGTKSSKWEILKRAIEYIDVLRHGQSDYVAEIERLRREVEMLGGGQSGAYAMGMGMATGGGEGAAGGAGAAGSAAGQGETGEVGNL